ncbi:MAG: LPS export ABC transporter permease LptG [Gemmatimonadaceae bacterium]
MMRALRAAGIRPLDLYVFQEFWKIFLTTALGFPVLVIVIDLTDNLQKYLERRLPKADIALSYIYWLPDSMFMVLPAAVLFATVFSIGGFTRHAEITAAKASGISFHRFARPIFIGAALAALLGLLVGEIAPLGNARRSVLLGEKAAYASTDRYNFPYAAENGRVYKISALNATSGIIDGLEIERKGGTPAYPTYILQAQQAHFTRGSGWLLSKGVIHLVPRPDSADLVVRFDSLRDHQFREQPTDLLAAPKYPQDMEYKELTKFITALERSGGDANELRVERALKIAIPITCIIIAFFGAPLATSTQRGGTAYGVGISLATTVTFLMLIQLTKAVGGKGLIPPELAAWVPSILFLGVGVYMLTRVRT